MTAGFASRNYGAGAEYWADKNGVRVEYRRMDFQGRGLRDADAMSLGHVRKF